MSIMHVYNTTQLIVSHLLNCMSEKKIISPVMTKMQVLARNASSSQNSCKNCAERSQVCVKNEARVKRTKRAKRIRIEWNNVSLVVDVAIAPAAISRGIYREYARLPQGSLSSLAHLLHLGGHESVTAIAHVNSTGHNRQDSGNAEKVLPNKKCQVSGTHCERNFHLRVIEDRSDPLCRAKRGAFLMKDEPNE